MNLIEGKLKVTNGKKIAIVSKDGTILL